MIGWSDDCMHMRLYRCSYGMVVNTLTSQWCFLRALQFTLIVKRQRLDQLATLTAHKCEHWFVSVSPLIVTSHCFHSFRFCSAATLNFSFSEGLCVWAVHPSVLIAAPEKYDGDPVKCWGFLLQFELYITLFGEMMNQHKVANHLSYRYGVWLGYCYMGEEPITSFNRFLAMFRWVFNHVPEGREVEESPFLKDDRAW